MNIVNRTGGALLALVAVAVAGCAAPGDAESPREDTAIVDFIEVNELAEVDRIRTVEPLAAREVNRFYVIASTRREDFLIEYFSRCYAGDDGRVEPDVRRDSRSLYAGADTFRGCRIKAIYALEPGQADELREIGRAARR